MSNTGSDALKVLEGARVSDVLDNSYDKTFRVLLSDQEAARLLKANDPNNRDVRKAKVKEYTKKMQEGKFFPTDPLKFRENGVLISGQHRLLAHSRVAGLTLEYPVSIVKSAFEQEVILNTDNLTVRTPRDNAKQGFGVNTPPSVSSAIKLCMTRGHRGGYYDKEAQTLAIVNEPHRIDLETLYAINKRTATGPLLAGVLLCLRGGAVREHVMNFFSAIVQGDTFVDGAGQPSNSAARVLINYLAGADNSKSQRETMVKAIVAYNAWRENKELKQLKDRVDLPEVVKT